MVTPVEYADVAGNDRGTSNNQPVVAPPPHSSHPSHPSHSAHSSHALASGAAPATPAADVSTVRAVADRIARNIDQVIEGKHDTIRLGVAVLLAEGHLLIEDVPGVGKTKLAKALARSIDCSVRRIQFTPDLLPSDVTGVSVYNTDERDFEFKPGPVFANIVVGDEINRASPKTQSALLECMEERQVTVDGVTYSLESPFLVLATQNPIDMEGTYPLPEAQRDRFTARISLGYPDRTAEIAMLNEHASAGSARAPASGLGRSGGARADRGRAHRPRRGLDQGLRRGHRRGDPAGERGAPRRVTPRHPATAAHREVVGRARRPRVRPARRHPVRPRRRCSPTGCS